MARMMSRIVTALYLALKLFLPSCRPQAQTMPLASMTLLSLRFRPIFTQAISAAAHARPGLLAGLLPVSPVPP
ncbi:hypothetical protein DFP72DRAFT_912771 [Ephemerocybe angulata]|uniref:Secreted protein n=1 Tax=Ephemerocybe angulata TaxID=980116 RepID=A0A8H6M076_9AGAR|nr:hypothetical protein DFP72DRAFT_912771 [Tulosesus angulatus]